MNSTPRQLYQHHCWCYQMPEPRTWWSHDGLSECRGCGEENEAIDMDWVEGIALYQCNACLDRWYKAACDFTALASCRSCKLACAPIYLAPVSDMPRVWINTHKVLRAPMQPTLAAHALNARIVHQHGAYSLKALLRNKDLLEAFGDTEVARIAGHWLVLSWYTHIRDKGFVRWTNAEGRIAVEHCRKVLAVTKTLDGAQ